MPELLGTSLYSDANLQAYYRFNSGALTTDSKNSNTLTNNSTVGETASGKFGYAADFGTPNTNKYFNINSAPGVTAYNGVFSASLWLKLGAEIASGAHGFFGMVTQTDATHRVLSYLNYEYNGGTRRLKASRYSDGGGSAGSNNGYYNTDLGTDWHHLVYTYTGSNIILYLNGVAVITQATTNHFGTTYTPVLWVGFSGGQYTPGSIDDFALFNRVLTVDEVMSLFQEKAGGLLLNFL